ncbi:hypothetical protein ES703_45167 [subsurface metagenome]
MGTASISQGEKANNQGTRGTMKEIHVKFAGVEKAPGGQFSILYIPDQRQVLYPGRRYRIVLDGLTYEESKPTEKKRR